MLLECKLCCNCKAKRLLFLRNRSADFPLLSQHKVYKAKRDDAYKRYSDTLLIAGLITSCFFFLSRNERRGENIWLSLKITTTPVKFRITYYWTHTAPAIRPLQLTLIYFHTSLVFFSDLFVCCLTFFMPYSVSRWSWSWHQRWTRSVERYSREEGAHQQLSCSCL